jgi:hypothetical protein
LLDALRVVDLAQRKRSGLLLLVKSRKTQFSVPGGGRGVGRGDLKIQTSSIVP